MYEFENDKIFCELVGLVLRSEGGYVNDPDDAGGPTKCGIALNYNAGICKEFAIFTAEDMKNKMTPLIAKQIYFRKYWKACGAHLIPDKKLAYTHFDMAVNAGVGTAARLLFKLSKNPAHFEAGGKNKAMWRDLFNEYQKLRLAYYKTCKTWWKHGKGWTNRNNHVTKAGLAMG